MAVITRLTAAEVDEALAAYSIGSLIGHKEASEGIENTNYFVRTQHNGEDSTEYVLTLIEELGASEEGRIGMVKILDCCAEAGLPVPRVVRTSEGLTESTYRDKPVLVCTKLDGRHVANPTRSQCTAIGRFLGRFHLATDPVHTHVKPYFRDQQWLREKTDRVKRELPPLDREILEQTLSTVLDLLQRSDVRELPESVIHADLFRDNGLFNEYGLSGILDFHHAGRGFCIYDVAVAVNDWCRNSDGLDEQRATALLRGYTSIRELTQEELWFFPAMLIYGALAFWLSRLAIYVRTDLPRHYPVKDPDEFKRLVQSFSNHPFNVLRDSLL